MKNLKVLLVVLGLGAFTACFTTFPNTWEEFFFGFAICSLFWGLMFAPAFGEN
jgi:hypothetical protein